MLKSLAVLYLLMAIIGLLGYFQIEEFSTSIFSFFYTLLGSYSIILPLLCLLFTVVCWRISRKTKNATIDEDEDEDDENDQYLNRDIKRTKTENPRQRPSKERHNNSLNTRHYKDLGFDSYFADKLLIKDGSISDQNYKSLGTNFSTYFGEGEKNIYLPSKTVTLNGFKDYFKDHHQNLSAYDKVVNENVMRENYSHRDFTPASKKPLITPVYNEPINLKVDNVTVLDIEHIAEKEELRQFNNQSEHVIQSIDKVPARKNWKLPGLELLSAKVGADVINEQHNPKLIEEVLSTFGVTAKVVNICVGPVLTRYELSPAPGTKINKIVNLSDDLALALASKEIRIEAPIPGKAAIGIEIPRLTPRTVYFREVIDSQSFSRKAGKLKVGLGKDIADNVMIAELEKMPHLLVAGATGSGKSIFINCLINSLLYTVTPDEVKLLLIDPKMVELNQYNGIPHLLAPVVTDPKKASKYLKYIVTEMESRYELFVTNSVRDLEHYNKTNSTNPLPHIVVIIDELADLMMVAANDIEESICRIAQMARAAGIHLVLATQRPSVNVITGLIKANIPSRISFAVSSQIDSRTILDSSGAEKLLGKGDMLFAPIGLNKPTRVHGCYIDEQEIKNVIEHWKRQSQPHYQISEEQLIETTTIEQHDELDERFKEAGQLVIASGVASVSFLQRRLRVGYSRAARLMDMLEEAGVVGGYEGNKPRDIIMSLENFNSTY